MMANILNFAMLICATVGSMAFGILAAYWILRAGFAIIRPKQRHAQVKVQPETVGGL
jgi:hypothetical protein